MDKYIVVNLSLVTGGCKRIKMQEYNGSVICNKIQKVVTPYLQKHCTADSLLTLYIKSKKVEAILVFLVVRKKRNSTVIAGKGH